MSSTVYLGKGKKKVLQTFCRVSEEVWQKVFVLGFRNVPEIVRRKTFEHVLAICKEPIALNCC
jgi:hypothetical protein